MAFLATKSIRARNQVWHSLLRLSYFRVSTPQHLLEESVKMAVFNKTYEHIPDILTSKEGGFNNQNPFSFLSTFAMADRTRVVDDMLQSFVRVKPHTRLKDTYNYLLVYALQSSKPFPLALATLQRTLRSGCTPVPQTYLLLSSAWMDQRSEPQSVSRILLDMKSIGYRPDSGTCSFIIKSLCAVDQLEEATEVLHGMVEAACVPDVDCYGSVIAAYCQVRKTDKVVTLMQEMVGRLGLSPRQGTLVNVAAALRANKEIWRAAEMIKFLETKGFNVGFESYEIVVEGCLECREFILAGKMVMMMTSKGHIPFIKVRQKVVEGLAGVGEWDLACAVRHRFAELNS